MKPENVTALHFEPRSSHLDLVNTANDHLDRIVALSYSLELLSQNSERPDFAENAAFQLSSMIQEHCEELRDLVATLR